MECENLVWKQILDQKWNFDNLEMRYKMDDFGFDWFDEMGFIVQSPCKIYFTKSG